MPFNLGFLGGGGAQGPAPSHGAGPGALGDLGRLKISQGYLEEQKSQNAYNREQDFNAKVEKEQGRRREAIDAWLGAVRSGNRADVFVLGKRLNAMGINVQMPTAFSATGVPGENDLAAPGAETLPAMITPEPPAAAPMTPGQAKTGAAVDKLGTDVVGKLGGTFEPPGTAAPSGGTQFFDADAGEDVSEEEFNRRLGPPGQTTSGTSAVNPFGPNGPTTIKAPTSTWKVTDPVTGTNIEISPEEILADQYKEIDQTFGPLTQMPGLDETAQRAYQIGHEYAKGQIGFLTPKEAAAAGMAAADRYMTHMYQQGMVTAATLKAMKGARGGGGGAPGYGAPGKQGGAIADKILDNARATIKDAKTSENYLGRVKAIDQSAQVMQSFDQNTGVGDANALGQYIKSISGAATTDKERAFYARSAGVRESLNNIYGQWVREGRLSPALMRQLRSLITKANELQRQTNAAVGDEAVDRAVAEAELQLDEHGITDPERRKRYIDTIRSVGGKRGKKGGGSKENPKGTDEAARLLE